MSSLVPGASPVGNMRAAVPEGLGFRDMRRPVVAYYAGTVLVLAGVMIGGAAKGSSAVCLYMAVLLVFLIFGDLLYSRFLANIIFRLSDEEITPAHDEANKGHPDFVATPSFVLFGHHWTSITGAAPIIGPAIACYHGWLPAMLWVVLGSILAGSVHDFSVLAISARNDGRSIADLAGLVISWRARVLFLLVIMFLCWTVLAVFMNAIASLFMSYPETVLPINAEIPMALLVGLVAQVAARRLSSDNSRVLIMAMSALVLVLLYGLVFAGVAIEDHGGTWEEGKNIDPVFGFALHTGKGNDYTVRRALCRDSVNFAKDSDGNPTEATCAFGAMQVWTVLLTVYGLVASVIPVWMLLQPRDFINSHQLKLCMVLMLLGLIVKSPSIDAEAFRSEVSEKARDSAPIFPTLFTTVACGAVSGFHGLVSSGVTSRQLDRMRDARPIGYTGMLGEAALSALVIVICCSSGYWARAYASWPVNWGAAFIPGAAQLLEELGLGERQARSVIIVLVVSFAATTLDSGMRIQRVLIEEFAVIVEKQLPLLGKVMKNIFVAGLLSAVPSCALANSRIVSSLWNLFGATNQLVACLSLITVGIYVWRYHRCKPLYVVPFLLPAVWLGVLITWALARTIIDDLDPHRRPSKVIDWFSTVPTYPSIIMTFLIAASVLAVMLEASWYFLSRRDLVDAEISTQTGKILAAEGLAGSRDMPKMGCC